MSTLEMLIFNVIKIISIINFTFSIFIFYIVVFITISIVLLLNEKRMICIVRLSNSKRVTSLWLEFQFQGYVVHLTNIFSTFL